MIKKSIGEEKIYKIEEGIYSNEKYVSELAIISFRYPKAIFTLNSAFYYHGLTDVIPNYYYLLTTSSTKGIKDKRVKQFFENTSEIELGLTTLNYNNTNIRIYNKERLLIELIRNKNKLPFDYYKEILLNFRKITNELDIQTIQEYANSLPKKNMVLEVLQLEVL
jgi:hypothetical protein